MVDQQNPGAKRTQVYGVNGALSASKADHEVQGVDFVKLTNCLIDRRLGAVVKRPGSTLEDIAGPVGTPLGIGEHLSASASTTIPVTRTLLLNAAGANWRQNIYGSWNAVSVQSGMTFGTAKQTRFTQLGDTLYIAAGTPARWQGAGETIKRIGIIPCPTAPTITSYNTGTGITLTNGTSYIITCYDSATGLESDWSPISDPVSAITNKEIVIGLPAGASPAGNWDSFRIYRYYDGGAMPYLVDTVTAAATTYTDTTPDEDLTTPAPARYRNGIPPESSYITSNYSSCLWFVDADDPHKLVFSLPYTGSQNEPQYFPATNYVRTADPITGLLVTGNKMLVFHPRSISMVIAGGTGQFSLQPIVPGLGTVFGSSIATNGTDIVFLAEQGFVAITFGEGSRIHLSREIDLDLQPILAGAYNTAIYVSSAWSPSLRQFIFAISATSSDDFTWVDSGTGLPWEWVYSGSGSPFTWVYSSGTGTAVSRVKIWGWSPELSSPQANRWMEYNFPQVVDGNADGQLITCMFHPSSSSDSNDPQQDKTLIGYYSGSAGGVISAFRKDSSTDSGAAITSEIITSRICPGDPSANHKLFCSLGFMNAYSDPTSDSLATLSYLIDFDDPQIRSYAGSLFSLTGSSDRKLFPTMQGRHIHLRVLDTSESQSKILLSQFTISYRERRRQSAR